MRFGDYLSGGRGESDQLVPAELDVVPAGDLSGDSSV